MKFELNLIENSHDYITSSFDLFIIADEYGMHDEQKTEFENKVKWKLAFVTMVQAFELLLKECLYRIHPNLIYENIDSEKLEENKTVSFQQAIKRINNFCNNKIEEDKVKFLIDCSKIRNGFIHYKVNIQSEKIKSKYCVLYSIYKELYLKFIGQDITFNKKNHEQIEYEILNYDKNWTIFRGREINKNDLEELRKEIIENDKYKYYITIDGDKVERIRYGEEINRVNEELKKLIITSVLNNFEICGECLTKTGEYHLENCDLEICPVCFGQLITCGCIESDEEGYITMVIDA